MSAFVRAPIVERGDRRAALSVFLLLLAVFTATFSGLPDNPDAEVEFQTARSIVRERRLALGDTPEARAIVENRFNVVPGGPGREGRFYSWHGIGQALVAAPFYAGGSLLARLFPAIEGRHAATFHRGYPRSEYFAHLVVGWRNPLLSAWTAALIVITARRLRARRVVAWATGVGYGLCTFAWPQARSTLSDVQAAFFVFLAFHELVCVRESFLAMRAPRLFDLALLGLALGAAVLTKVLMLPLALVLFVAALIVLGSGRRMLTFRADRQGVRVRDVGGYQMLALALPVLACAGLFFLANYRRFGSVFETGYGAVLASGTFFSYPPLLGLAGLVVSPGKGLLWMAPGLLLAPLALHLAWSKKQVLWPWTTIALGVASLGPLAFTQTWTGAYTYGPRYVLPFLPLAWLSVSYVLESRRVKPWTRGLVALLLVFGFVVQLPAALVDHRTHQDLAVQAARVRWPDPGGSGPLEQDEARFLAMQWDWGFAAPWAHWRILRHRVAGLSEDFAVRDVFLMDSDAVVRPLDEREQGFNHLAWVDLEQRLGIRSSAGIFVCLLLLGAGVLLSIQSLERSVVRHATRPL